jgi:hypothetical protein
MQQYLWGEQDLSVPGEDVPELQLLEPDWLELELECEWLRDLDRE